MSGKRAREIDVEEDPMLALKKMKGDDDEEEEEEEGEGAEDGQTEDKLTVKQREERRKELERQRNSALLKMLDDQQLTRYEHYRRSGFKKAAMKRLVSSIVGSSVSDQVGIAVSGISKIFVGELVEKARVVMVEWGHKGPTRPEHIREAFRRIKAVGKMPMIRQHKKLFKR